MNKKLILIAYKNKKFERSFKNRYNCEHCRRNTVLIEIKKDQNLNEIVSKLKNHFQPLKVYLFGSRANGTAKPNSDYDLFLIVKNSEKTRLKRMQEAYQILKDRKVAVDVFIYTEAEFEEWKNEFNSVPNAVFTEGLELNFD